VNETWKVMAGMPSWHQHKAGATCAEVHTGFKSKSDAMDWADRYRARHGQFAVAVVMQDENEENRK